VFRLLSLFKKIQKITGRTDYLISFDMTPTANKTKKKFGGQTARQTKR
jgi:hypothetical protein